jgi:glycine/serine hydroxymethyltransferase
MLTIDELCDRLIECVKAEPGIPESDKPLVCHGIRLGAEALKDLGTVAASLKGIDVKLGEVTRALEDIPREVKNAVRNFSR